MQKHERKEFAEALTQLFAVYGADLTDRVLTAWWGVLSPYKLNAVLAAMNLHAGDVERGMYRPTPADVRKHLELTIPGMIRARRERIARDARERCIPLRERAMTAENDLRLGLLTPDEAERIIGTCQLTIAQILAEPDVVLALAPLAELRDDEAEIAPRDRLPDVVRRALGWLGRSRG